MDAGCRTPQHKQTGSQREAGSSGSKRHADQGIAVEIGVACNSSSMGFAFLHGGMKAPECLMLRQGSDAPGNRTSYETFSCFGSHHNWDILM